MYNEITASVQVYGANIGTFDIQRSVWQGCPLSMLLYVIAIEILSLYIRKNTNIKGIKIPNLKEEFKMLQHADDCTNSINDSNSFNHLQKEYESFGKASRSQINHDKLKY